MPPSDRLAAIGSRRSDLREAVVIPTLHSQRLLLRAPSADDFPVYRKFYADADASYFYGGPLSPDFAWRKLAYDLGHWPLRGYGMWSIVEKSTGRMIGGCGLVWAEGWPRRELTWWITPASRRRGYALEASRTAIAWAFDSLGWQEVETHMDDDNNAARELAKKLGGTVTARQRFPDGYFRTIYSLPYV